MLILAKFEMQLIEELRWLRSPEGLSVWEELVALQEKERLKSLPLQVKLPDRRRHFLMEQLSYARLAREKFPNPEYWFWTKRLLEQASDYWCALETAADFPDQSKVLDICSGAGADAVALARRCAQVIAVDQDPIACNLTELNAARNHVYVVTKCCPAESLTLEDSPYVHLDPDRRSTGARVSALREFQPSWETISTFLNQCQGLSMKVAPATTPAELPNPPSVVRFLSRNRSVRQQRWIWGLDRWPQDSLVISACLRNEWHHEIFPMSAYGRIKSGDYTHSRDVIQDSVTEFIADYEPAIRAANCSLAMAQRLGCQLLHQEGGYLLRSQPIEHPMLRWFRVVEVLPLDRKKLIAYCRKFPARQWEFKSRGVEVNLQELSRSIPTSADEDRVRTILFAKVENRHRAIIADPLASDILNVTSLPTSN